LGILVVIIIWEKVKIALQVAGMTSEDWCVAVFKCKPNDIRKIVPVFYKFVKDLEGVKSLHFIIRDSLEDKVIFSFRVLIEKKTKRVIASKMAYRLGRLLPKGEFAVDPEPQHPLGEYVAWSAEERIFKSGSTKFTVFCSLLEKLSKLGIQMIRSGYISSDERVEIAHVMSWMLGCTEYGVLSTAHMEVGYYDRIEDKYHKYLQQEFPNP
jgi:hypothetical protein